jgi:hemerythrin-like metal-binding protein
MSVATGTFRWTEALSVNIAVLDQRHQQLIDTMNQLDQALRKGEGKAAVDPVLDKPVEYALVHFVAEESLMEQHDFPGLSTHRTQHEEFRKRLAEYLEAQARRPGFTPVLHARVDEGTSPQDRQVVQRFSQCAWRALTQARFQVVFARVTGTPL